ncbi:hypothetical protein U1Q18_020709 [Sarracenia purpurea var. burkii]
MGVVVNKSLAQVAKLTDFVEPVQMWLPEPPISPRAQIRTGGAVIQKFGRPSICKKNRNKAFWLKEIGGRSKPPDSLKPTDQPAEKKKSFIDWMSVIKPGNEEKDHWHHCRNCGDIFCDKCTHGRIALTTDENAQLVRVCDRCMAEITQRYIANVAVVSVNLAFLVAAIGELNSKITDEVLVLDEEGEDSLGVVKKICDPFSGAPNYSYAPENCSKDSIPIGVLPSVLQDSLVTTRTQESAKGMGTSFRRPPI